MGVIDVTGYVEMSHNKYIQIYVWIIIVYEM